MRKYLIETIETYEKNAHEYAKKRNNIPPIDELKYFSSLLMGSKVLEIGIGPGRDLVFLHEGGMDVFGIDICDNFLNICHINAPQAHIAKMDTIELGFKRDTFSGIWCCAVLSHLNYTDVFIAIEEFFRVLNDNGILFIAVKSGVRKCPYYDKEFSSYKRIMFEFEKKDIAEMLSSAGFVIDRIYEYNEKDRFGHPYRDINFWFIFAKKK